MFYVIDFGSKKTPHIAEYLRKAGATCEVVPWLEPGRVELSKARGMVFSGSPTFFTEVDHAPYISRYSFVKSGNIPTLGICFGHQLMGLLHGSMIFRGRDIRETVPLRIMKRDVLFEGLSRITEMAEDHTEGITLPPGFIHLATSGTYTIEGMRHPHLPLWGVQFHPEVSGLNGETLIANFVRACS